MKGERSSETDQIISAEDRANQWGPEAGTMGTQMRILIRLSLPELITEAGKG